MTDYLRFKILNMRCAKCGHNNGWHSDTGDACYFCNYHDPEKCLCTKFVPSDNLTWVEYLSEKKGLI